MRMLAAASLVLLPLSASAQERSAQPQAGESATRASDASRCDRFGRADRARAPSVLREPAPRAQRLIDLPPADLDLAVMREVDGCRESVTITENFGGAGGPRPVRPAERNPPPPRARLAH